MIDLYQGKIEPMMPRWISPAIDFRLGFSENNNSMPIPLISYAN
jgi:hypothetical protein